MPKKAEDYLHCPDDNYNCAQAVLKAFQQQFNISDETITKYKKFGGGRVENNICGALFAATQLLAKQPEKAEIIKQEFVEIAGATKCKDLKAKQFACRNCVKLAAELLKKLQ